MAVRFGPWDAALLVAVSLQATTLAYVRAPRWKATIMGLPIPFTFTTLAVGRPVGASNVTGLALLFLFTLAVWLLHQRLHLPVVAAIALSAAGYCAAGAALVPILPGGPTAFWLACAGILALALALLRALPTCEEPGCRSALPLWIKLPAVAGVILFIIVVKNGLQGFATVFPMMGTVAAYEARRSLWTNVRQIPVIMVTLVPLMVTSRLAEPHIGLAPSLLVGWLVFLAILIPLTRALWRRPAIDTARAGR